MTDINFLERFVLAENRLEEIALEYEENTEDYWYYKLLTLQSRYSTSNEPPLKAALKEMGKIDSIKDSRKLKNLLFRQAIKDYSADNAEDVCKQVKATIKPSLNHIQDDLAGLNLGGTQYKSTINIGTANLLKEKFTMASQNGDDILSIFSPPSAEYLCEQDKRGKLNATQIGQIMDLIDDEPPQLPYLLTLIKKDLDAGTKFGARKVHYKLTRAQMAQVASKTPSLFGDGCFCKNYCRKLRPVTDIKLMNDLEGKAKYYEALLKFSQKMKNEKLTRDSTVIINLKALIVYRTLAWRELMGQGYDKALFLRYLKMPRQTSTGYTSNTSDVGFSINFSIDEVEELPAIGNDEPFIRRALREFFLTGTTPQSYAQYLDEAYVRPLFAEVFLTDPSKQGKGQEKAQLAQREILAEYRGKGAFRALTERVDLELAPNNPIYYRVKDPCAIKLFVKNVARILVNVYEVDGKNYYIQNKYEVPTNIDLSGSSPIITDTYLYNDPTVVRRPRVIQIPKLRDRRGVFVVDIIGGGFQCRALLRKGELRFIEETDAQGYVFQVFDEQGNLIPTASIWMDGCDYIANEKNEIRLPFADGNEERVEMIILDDETPGAATMQHFKREPKYYDFNCGIYIDRESLLEKQQAQVIIRPNVYLNHEWVSTDILQNVQLKLKTTTLAGVVNSRAEPIELYDTQETVFNFTVPLEIRRVDLTLTADIEGQAFTNEQTYEVNEIDETDCVADIFLYPYGRTGYVLAVLGKNGEPLPGRVLDLQVNHRYLVNNLKFTLETDANGRVFLGRLYDCLDIEVICRDPTVFRRQTWNLLEDMANVPPVFNAKEGATVRIPYIGTTAKGPRVCVYDIDYIEDFSDRVSYENGYITIAKNDKGACLPQGDFRIFIRDLRGLEVELHISAGAEVSTRFGDFVISTSRFIQLSEDVPLQIASIVGHRYRCFTVKLQGFNNRTRVNVIATSFIPRFTAYGFLCASANDPDIVDFSTSFSSYIDQTEVVGEYKYVLGRYQAEKRVGNMLSRPSFLMSNWSPDCNPVRPPKPPPAPPRAAAELKQGRRGERVRKEQWLSHIKCSKDISNLEFLAEGSRVYPNVRIAEDGTVQIPPQWLTKNDNLIQVIAADDDNTSLRYKVLDKSDEEQKTKDVTLFPGLDPTKHYTEVRKVIPLLKSGDELRVEDFQTSDIEVIQDLRGLFNYFRTYAATVSAEMKKTISEFAFMTVWNTLSQEEKLAAYDKYACNEVNLFVRNRDNAFFQTVVRPILQSKIQKSFMDLWLLEDPRVESLTTGGRFRTLVRRNAVERILLASRLNTPDWTKETMSAFQQWQDLQAATPALNDKLFNIAAQSCTMSDSQIDELQGPEPVADAADEVPTIDSPLKASEDPVRERTREYQDTQYYGVPIDGAVRALIPNERLWNDYCKFLLSGEAVGTPFISPWLLHGCRNKNEMLLTMALTDLPFVSDAPELNYVPDNNAVILKAADPCVVLLREIRETEVRSSPFSVSVNFYDPGAHRDIDNDPAFSTEIIDGDSVDKFITDGRFMAGRVYACRVVVTNVANVPATVEILCQIPTGAIPVKAGFKSKNWWVNMKPFDTEMREFRFYFPSPGNFRQFPVHVNKNGKTLGYGLDLKNLVVVEERPPPDRSSWKYISQQAPNEEVLKYLENSPEISGANIDLERIAWRLTDDTFFGEVTRLLRERKVYSEPLWQYSVNFPSAAPELGEYLSLNQDFNKEVRPYFTSDLVNYNAVVARDYQFQEYTPLINKRVDMDSTYGTTTKPDFKKQYQDFLFKAAYSSSSVKDMNAADTLTAVYYLILQGKIVRAREVFADLDAGDARAVSAMAHDYTSAFLSLYDSDKDSVGRAAALVKKWKESGVLTPSKEALWSEVQKVLDDFADQALADDLFDEAGASARRGLSKPAIDFEVMGRDIVITSRNVTKCVCNFYKTDIEMLFSENPFPDKMDKNFKLITPTISQKINMTEDVYTLQLPRQLLNENMVLEIQGGGLNIAKPIYDNFITIQLAAAVGQFRVLQSDNGSPVPGAYVKVYGRRKDNGDSIFFKDGYTDFRGRFDYRCLSNDLYDNVTKFGVLVLTDDFGASILELDP